MAGELSFESKLAADIDTVWKWMISFHGISREMAPILRMSTPKGVTSLNSVALQPGVPMFRSWVKLFGIIPIDYTDLTLLSLTPHSGFVEQSKMGSMKVWRHERSVFPYQTGCRITDVLRFEPRLGGRIVIEFVQRFFEHRHKMLRKYLGSLD
jgi:ligand-binding SRPBCC domain-containing protein